MRYLLPNICIMVSLVSVACTTKSTSYDLDLESCYAMRTDKSHPNWQHAVAIKSCEMLISDHEMEMLSKEKE